MRPYGSDDHACWNPHSLKYFEQRLRRSALASTKDFIHCPILHSGSFYGNDRLCSAVGQVSSIACSREGVKESRILTCGVGVCIFVVVRCSMLAERYRSGHNGAVLKTVRGQPHAGSNPVLSAILTTYGFVRRFRDRGSTERYDSPRDRSLGFSDSCTVEFAGVRHWLKCQWRFSFSLGLLWTCICLTTTFIREPIF
jgi:hypothetical protein